jgi:hypothetical protein
MSKSTKKVLAVVAAVAVPFVAPAIAGSIGLTSALASTGMAATTAAATGSALTGAVLGGAASSFGGGDFGTGAVLGAVGGGLSGYGAATRAATAVPEGSTLAIGPRGEYLAAPGAGVSGPPAPVNLVAAGPGAVAAPVAGTAGAAGAVTPAATATATGTAAAGTAPTLGAALSSAVAGLTDPATLARVTMLASTALNDPGADIMAGLSPQEVELVEMRKQELQRIASTNMSLFEQQVMAAQNFLQQAEQQGPNPEQAYAETKIAAERQLAEESRGLGREQASAIQRRGAIRGATVGATAAAAEESRGRTAQTQLMQAGLTALPTAAPEGYAGLALPMYQDLAERRRQQDAEQAFAMGQFGDALFGRIG